MPELQLIKCVYILRYPAYHLISTCKISTIECDICFALCTHTHTQIPCNKMLPIKQWRKLAFFIFVVCKLNLKKSTSCTVSCMYDCLLQCCYLSEIPPFAVYVYFFSTTMIV